MGLDQRLQLYPVEHRDFLVIYCQWLFGQMLVDALTARADTENDILSGAIAIGVIVGAAPGCPQRYGWLAFIRR